MSGYPVSNTANLDATRIRSDQPGEVIGAVNGSNAIYTVSQGWYTTNTLIVFLNGQKQVKGALYDWTEITPGSGTFSFNIAPATGDLVEAYYAAGIINSASGISEELTIYYSIIF